MAPIDDFRAGPTDTDANPDDGASADMLRTHVAVPRYSTAHEIPAMVAYLAGREAGFITGAGVAIDGGFTA